MAFLDNSGDIILDAVLTDTGRKRLAAGDGSFRIAKYAFSDDEIDYSLYRNANSAEGRHPSGSAYYDVNILQTPVLEAFTNNTSILNHKLVTYSRPDLLYLPVLLNNDIISKTVDKNTTAFSNIPVGGYLITADYTTSDPDTFKTSAATTSPFRTQIGIIRGNRTFATAGQFVCVDQGLNNTDLSVQKLNAGDPLKETRYLVEMDNRLGQILSLDGTTVARPSFIDDDNIATYFLSENTDSGFVKINPKAGEVSSAGTNPSTEVIKGPKGTIINFRIQSSLDLNTSTFLFTKLGSTTTVTIGGASVSVRFIDTIIKVTGATTGYRVDIPVRFIKKI